MGIDIMPSLNEVETNFVLDNLTFLCQAVIPHYYCSQRYSPLPLSVMVDKKAPQGIYSDKEHRTLLTSS